MFWRLFTTDKGHAKSLNANGNLFSFFSDPPTVGAKEGEMASVLKSAEIHEMLFGLFFTLST